jgi:hypothetical protein
MISQPPAYHISLKGSAQMGADSTGTSDISTATADDQHDTCQRYPWWTEKKLEKYLKRQHGMMALWIDHNAGLIERVWKTFVPDCTRSPLPSATRLTREHQQFYRWCQITFQLISSFPWNRLDRATCSYCRSPVSAEAGDSHASKDLHSTLPIPPPSQLQDTT